MFPTLYIYHLNWSSQDYKVGTTTLEDEETEA